MSKNLLQATGSLLIMGSLLLGGCSPKRPPTAWKNGDRSLVLALAVLAENDDGTPKPLPGQLGILTRQNGQWTHRTLEDADNNVFHKAMAYGSEGLLTLGGTKAVVKLWRTNGVRELLWEADFGGQFSRMRDAEVGDIYGDGKDTIAIATHDQGVVATLRPDAAGGFRVQELDRHPDTVVHEIELGDLDGDGVLEIYATPTAPNKVDGTTQPGKVMRYVPKLGQGPTVVADLGERHAKEILVADLDGDHRDELYVSVEAVSGGKVEILRYLAATRPTEGELVATLDDTLCRFLTVGDVDGDGKKEMVAATMKSGLWLLRPNLDRWDKELIDAESGGFEHASILLDLDRDGRDELYVASDNRREVRRYDWTPHGWRHEVLLKYEDKLSRITWNIMAVPTALLPASGVAMRDVKPAPQTPETTQKPAQPRGLRLNSGEAEPGYVLYAPILSDTTYLIDAQGVVVHVWKSDYAPSGTVYLQDNGTLLRGAREPNVAVFKGGGQGGRLQEFSWDGKLTWDWKFADEHHLLHHDIEPLPNGNILIIAWEAKSAKEANRAGRRPDLTPQAGLWPDTVLEVEPQRPNDARIVWEWHMWDHLIQAFDPEKAGFGVPTEHPELIDINGDGEVPKIDPAELARLKALGYVPAGTKQNDIGSDLLHMNAVAYNAELDQIAVSTPRFNEIWIIDHSTTTAQAAGHSGGRWKKGGDLLYRWGNPRAYSRGTKEQQTLFGQHDIRWIEKGLPGAGHLMVFNNNAKGSAGPHSAVLEWVPPTQPDGSYVVPQQGPFGPDQPLWKYESPGSFHSGFIAGARRLAGGNTLICSGADGRIFEVTKEEKVVWDYWDPYSGQVRQPDGSPPHPVGKNTYAVFRAAKIPPQHPALAGRDLRPIDPQPRPAVAATAK
ncbi:MAG TPA: aryl-sulfate sulfotransferase [Verrucomicrobiae bacterium]|nr:aryl-sulfate sulfotransferase [Verrucomicrobiae bacterium]